MDTTAAWLTLRLAATTTLLLAVIGLPLAWWLAIPLGFGLPGTLWAVVTASLLAACLLMGRFYLLTRRAL